MIKNKKYKSYYLKDILSYIIKELEIDINKYDITTLGNYYHYLILAKEGNRYGSQ